MKLWLIPKPALGGVVFCFMLLAVLGPLSAEADETALVNMLRSLSSDVRALREEVRQLKSEVQRLRLEDSKPASAKANVLQRYTLDLHVDDHGVGDAEAKVVIIEYSDYQCPFCARHQRQTYPLIKKNYLDTGKARYIVRDFPLGFHKFARDASLAAICAERQSAYQVMHDGLMANQKGLNRETIEKLAGDAGLNMDAFQACLGSENAAKLLEKRIASGKEMGVRGTPTFFVGRLVDGKVTQATRISGAQAYPAFAKIVDSYF
ncbi:MAG: DsbA family protein [Chromatiales bacterium]|nr:DsbA family protein [Chromatiales bacterium]